MELFINRVQMHPHRARGDAEFLGDFLVKIALGQQRQDLDFAQDQIRRFARAALSPTPPTLSRAVSRLITGVFERGGRAVGLLDDARLFSSFRERLA